MSVAVGIEDSLDPTKLTIFERCRLIRQLSKRCTTRASNKLRGLEGAHPGLCQSVGNFYSEFRFQNCLSEESLPVRDENPLLDDYASANLALLEVEFEVDEVRQYSPGEEEDFL